MHEIFGHWHTQQVLTQRKWRLWAVGWPHSSEDKSRNTWIRQHSIWGRSDERKCGWGRARLVLHPWPGHRHASFCPLYCAPTISHCAVSPCIARAGCIFAHPHPLYRGVSRRQRTAAAELAMPGRAPPGVSIEKLAAPPYPFLHLGADMAGQEQRQRPGHGAAWEEDLRTRSFERI